MASPLRWVLLWCLLAAGCSRDEPEIRPLPLPAPVQGNHVTDQMQVAGKTLVLWDEGGGCKLQVGGQSLWLKPMAACHFIKAPGRQEVEVFRLDKTTQMVAVVGTPTQKSRCGQEVQGVILRGNEVKLSTQVMRGSVYCADQGLQSFQFGLLAKP